MEVIKTSPPAWLDKTHPNYERWERAREISEERGKFVESILSKKIAPTGLCILDLGSGEGGTSKILSKKNDVISFDLSKERLQRQVKDHFQKVCGDSAFLPFKDKLFDVIVLQDVIEHIPDNESMINSLHFLLKEGGIIYLSTPNKFSVLNVVADPHWGVPFVSLLKRASIKKYFLSIFRKTEAGRKDIAELSSLNNLLSFIEGKFEVKLYTEYAVKELINGNKGIVWSNFHLKLVRAINILKLGNIISRMANDEFGLINKFFTPTFYFILTKKYPH